VTRISAVRPADLGQSECDAWRRMCRASRGLATPFLAPEFTLGVGRARPSARVAVLEDSSGIVGFFPFERRRFGIGKPIGAGLSAGQGLVHAPGLQWSPEELLRRCRLALWEFDDLVTDQGAFTPFHASAEPAPLVDLSQGYEHYLEHLRRGRRRLLPELRRNERRLQRTHGDARFAFQTRDHGALEDLIRLKSAQYRRTGRPDPFAWPGVRALLHDFLDLKDSELEGVLSVLHVDDRLAAVNFNLRSGPVLAGWFSAYDREFAPYSPGLLPHLREFEAAAAAGITDFDLGKGDQPYKRRLESRAVPVAEGCVDRPSARALARRALRAPGRSTRAFILRHPPVRRTVRSTLGVVGRARTAMG
jgi:CelD/BcsL family acetyltransferase involved in cellulose biosynthesis